MDVSELLVKCRGRWQGIYDALGINIEYKKQIPCPLCGGDDRFVFDNKFGNGDYFCRHCGADNGISLVRQYFKLTFPETLKKISSVVGMATETEQKPSVDPKIALTKLWQNSKPLTGSDPVSKYLHSRSLNLTPLEIKYCPNCWESGTKKKYPAMIARVRNKQSKPITLHRTYLEGNKKANISSPKKLMPGTENLNGAAVRLFNRGGMFEDDTLGVAEGIETAISATQMFLVATWACLSNVNLEHFEPPESVRKVMIFSDNDPNFVGQKSAYILANRLYNKDVLVELVMPNRKDFNDELKAR